MNDLLAVAEGLDLLQALNGMDPELTREGRLPRWFIPRVLWWRTVAGDERLSAMQEELLLDVGMLRRLGCPAREIRGGFNPGCHRGAHPSWHVDSLRHSLKPTAVGQFYARFPAVGRARSRLSLSRIADLHSGCHEDRGGRGIRGR